MPCTPSPKAMEVPGKTLSLGSFFEKGGRRGSWAVVTEVMKAPCITFFKKWVLLVRILSGALLSPKCLWPDEFTGV